MTPLLINATVRAQIKDLITLADANPVDMPTLQTRIATAEGKRHHMAQMTQQTINIPIDFMVTYSIEHGQRCGPCRHMSMSVGKKGRVPNPVGLWMVAQEFGFWGALDQCEAVWDEKLLGHGIAINIVQRINRP